MKRCFLLVICFSFVLASPLSADNDTVAPIHGDYFSDLGVGWVYWNYKEQRALVLPFSEAKVWGSGSFFGTSSWRLAWGGPDYINLSWGTAVHYFPFGKFVDISAGAYLGTFIFLDVTLLLQPKVLVNIPVGQYGAVGVGAAYNLQLAVLTTQIEQGIGYIDGIEAELVWSTKIN